MGISGYEVDELSKTAIVREIDRSFEIHRGNQLDQSLTILVHQARILVGAHQAALSYIPGGNFQAATHAVSFSEKYERYKSYDVMPTGQGIWAAVVEQKIAFCMTHDELISHPRWRNFSGLKDARGLEHPPMRGWLAVPILNQHHDFTGFLQLTDKYVGEFNQQDLELLKHLAKLIEPTFELQTAAQELQRLTEELQSEKQSVQKTMRETDESRRRAEAVEERLNLALKSSGVGTWSWDIVRNSIIWDDFIHPLFGLAPGTFPGRYEDFLQALPPEDRERVTTEVAASVEADAPYDTEYQVIWPDGSLHVLGSRGMVYRDAAGNALRMTGVCWDITEKRRLEERFRAAVESAPAAMLLVDAGGRILLINRQTEELFGYSRQELVGSLVENLVPVQFRSGHPQLRGSFFSNPQTRRMGSMRVLAGLRRDGSEFPLELGLNPIQSKDGLLVLAAVVDITERQRTQDLIARRTEELARSNEELEQFAYVASHDLQEPLRKIQTFGSMLMAAESSSLSSEGKDYLSRMQLAAGRMQNLIQDLLSYARVTSQAKSFALADLNRIAAEVVSDLEARVASTGAQVELGNLPSIEADPPQMRQLLQNLISNALKFRRPDVNPVVSVSARILKNGDQPETGFVGNPVVCELCVKDNGIGFDTKYLDRIFSPFQRLHSRAEYEGTGIGLAICRKIVDRHRGRITARSIPGEGTTFVVMIPVKHTVDSYQTNNC